ncbi:MAG: hypothetical protein HUU01_02355 [Saprospiraceae bacterium]|nr:hypothetical protein [Saprospiraceae bacterium]
MSNFLQSLFGKADKRIKIFEGMGNTPQPNFRMVATHVREGLQRPNYRLDDGSKWGSIVQKWQFKQGGALLRCGYDYQIVFTNGDVNIPISICFMCKSLVFNHKTVYKTSKRQILALLKEDFSPI